MARLSESDVLWRFAGYLAGEASVENAAKWSGAKPQEGASLLAKLIARLGWQAR